MKVKIGDTVRVPICEALLTGSGIVKKTLQKGTVEYVHPEGRFASIRIKSETGAFLESFPDEEIEEVKRCARHK